MIRLTAVIARVGVIEPSCAPVCNHSHEHWNMRASQSLRVSAQAMRFRRTAFDAVVLSMKDTGTLATQMPFS